MPESIRGEHVPCRDAQQRLWKAFALLHREGLTPSPAQPSSQVLIPQPRPSKVPRTKHVS